MDEARRTFGPFALDWARGTLLRDGEPIAVGQRGLAVLEALLGAEGAIVGKAALLERAWPGIIVEEGNLPVQIAALRKALGARSDGQQWIVTVPRLGYRLPWDNTEPLESHSQLPSLAVLPFANHGNTAEDGYFADGVVDDIITALSRFKTFAVLSRGSSFALRNKGADARSAAADLGVRYALEGSIRRMGDRLRVTAQLLDASTGSHLWADRYDGALADVFSFQDRITESVVGVIEPTLRRAEIERARRKPAATLDAYDLYLKALPMVHAPGPEQDAEAIELLNKAVERDPSFALARAYAGLVYEKRMSLRVTPLSDRDTETCIELARTALALGGEDPLVRAICGWLLFRVAKDVSALEGLRAAVRENPNNVVILTMAAQGVGMHGCFEESIGYHSRAYALSPGSHQAYENLQGIGSSLFLQGNYEKAIEWALKSLATFNDLIYNHVTLACCYVALDRIEEARAMVRRIRELNPALTIKAIEDGNDEEDKFGLGVISGLRKAGLPEW